MKADFHDPHIAHETVEGPSNRSFGLTVGGILTALGALRILIKWEIGIVSVLMLVVGVALLFLGLVRPQSLGTANRLWMRLGALLARIVNPVVLFLVYAIAFVPTGFIMRLRGYDPLRLKRADASASYWIRRSPQDPTAERMKNQF